jgi:hypothetical protein
MIIDNLLLGVLVVALIYTQYNLFVVRKQVEYIQRRLDELRN